VPNGIHIAIVVYGPVYTALLAEITLANLAAMVLEIPLALRRLSRVRIVTTQSDMPALEQAAAMALLRDRITVEIIDAARLSGYDQHGGYGPMVESQRLLVVEAARENAALFLVGPDLIFSRGSFALFVDRLRQGYRLLIGPGPRVNREAARAELRRVIAASADGAFALDPQQQTDLFFRNWHPSNNQFLIEFPESIWWKAYVCYRPHADELLFRFFQGPTFVAWPRHPKDDFAGFADHQLPELCCESWRQIYVVPDSDECLGLDLTDEKRFDVMELANFPEVFLLQGLFSETAIKDLKLRYGMRTCRVHRGERDPDLVRKWERDFARAVDPLLLLAVADRAVTRRIGSWAGAVFRTVAVLNTHTLLFLIGAVSPRILRRWKNPRPLEQRAAQADRLAPA
jgi:hypothetical protein